MEVMNNMKKVKIASPMLVVLSALLLTACDENEGLLDQPAEGATLPPEITRLDIQGAPIIDRELTALVECQSCEPDGYQYTWKVDGKLVGRGLSYVYREEDAGLDIELSVVGRDKQARSTQAARTYTTQGAKAIYSNGPAFAAVLYDDSVVTWGNPQNGGDSATVASQLTGDVISIQSSPGNFWAMAALKKNGQGVVWGKAVSGDASAVESELTNVKSIHFATFAGAALKNDGSVIAWGRGPDGGDTTAVAAALRSGVTQVVGSDAGFWAIKESGEAIFWGSDMGFNLSGLRSGVKSIHSSRFAVVALKDDGSVILTGAIGRPSPAVSAELSSGVKYIVTDTNYADTSLSGHYAFAAVKDTGIAYWHRTGLNGPDFSGFHSVAQVKSVVSTKNAFAALTQAGAVHTFGSAGFGGDSSVVAAQLTSGVKEVTGNERAFAALKQDGSVVVWGASSHGGQLSAQTQAQLNTGVTKVVSTNGAFAAIKNDGSVVTWGAANLGGDSSAVNTEISSGVYDVRSGLNAFLALKTDGSLVSWGSAVNGGDNTSLPHAKLSRTLTPKEV